MTKIIINGQIYLKRECFCEALIINNGRIVKTGSNRELLDEMPAGAEKIDAQGALVLPAFYDSHLHLIWVGRRENGIEAAGAESIEEVINRGREFIARFKPPPLTYIQGAGVNPDLFNKGEKRDLCRDDLDKISTEYPLILSRHCGHTIYCNSMALKLAGLSESAPEIAGGSIEKDERAKPTGVFREQANALVRKPMPPTSPDDIKRYLLSAMKKAHSLGISSCGSYDSGGPDFETVLGVYQEIYDESKIVAKPRLRVTMQCGISTREDMLDAYLKRKIYLTPLWEDPLWGCFLKMGSIKLFIDGTLGGHTAWMRQPYRDKPDNLGIQLLDLETLKRFVKKATAAGMQVLIHAIGDAGINAVLEAFESVIREGENPLRHGIIHCQITSKDLLERIAKNKILALVQPIFFADDMHILENRVGKELASTSYAWGSMHKLGIPVSFSTDAPVSPLDPLLCIQWAVQRGYNENVDTYDAFDAYSSLSAFSNHDESSLGRIAPGYLADLVFLERNIFNIPPESIHKAQVLRTICAGETVYNRE